MPASSTDRRSRLRILFVNGPNLNLLGTREPEHYGSETLEEIREKVTRAAEREGAVAEFFQSNHEGEIVECLQGAAERADGIVINPAGLTHTSVAIRDALLFTGLPAVEVHLSNPARREPFRRTSLIEDAVVGRVAGFGGTGYLLSLHGILDHLRKAPPRAGS
ncbi:MAG: type II 3-dehydroquinate dehydratase [Deltaproteobacteria bacterium]